MTHTAETDSTATLDAGAIVADYFDCWNAPDEQTRAEAIARTWAEDATSTDPLNQVTGRAAIQEMMAAVFDTYAGHTFHLLGDVDMHHDVIRWGWEVRNPDGERVLDGIDVARVDHAGRIAELSGFFGVAVPGGNGA